jgi:uncharacterized protein (DUF1800 family)
MIKLTPTARVLPSLPASAMPLSPTRLSQHLSWRAGFGPSLTEPVAASSFSAQLDALFAASAVTPQPLAAVSFTEAQEMSRRQAREQKAAGNESAFKDFQERQKAQRIQLNIGWIDQMTHSPAQLREKVALFWHDHFACRVPFTYLTQMQVNTFRTHALGSFRTLLTAVAQDPAMLQFLNNQQNRRGAPNENFARELLELFTLRRGHYAEADIKEAARAFTGWGFNQEGQFVVRRFAHDEDPKTFMGKTGNLDGTDIIGRVLEQRRCAEFLTQKFVAHFVTEAPPTPATSELVASLSKLYYESDYDTSKLLRALFSSAAFSDASVVGNRVKSPVELLVGLSRQLDVRYASPEPILFIQKVLGQILGFPPSVAGWPSGRQWIDTSSLLIRLKLSENILRAAAFDVKTKDDGDDGDKTAAMMRMATPEQRQALRQLKQVRATANLDALDRLAGTGSTDAQLTRLAEFFVQSELRPEVRRIVAQQLDRPNALGERTSTRLAIALLSLPDYQLA